MIGICMVTFFRPVIDNDLILGILLQHKFRRVMIERSVRIRVHR